MEGTTDEDPDAATWHEYAFKGKPGELRRIPRQFAPYHLRLDWLMWFLPLGHSLEDWFTLFLVKLLEADPPTLRLLRRRPVRRARRRDGCVRCRTAIASPTHAEFRESRHAGIAIVGAR